MDSGAVMTELLFNPPPYYDSLITLSLVSGSRRYRTETAGRALTPSLESDVEAGPTLASLLILPTLFHMRLVCELGVCRLGPVLNSHRHKVKHWLELHYIVRTWPT